LSSFYLNKTNTEEVTNNIQRLSPSFSIAWQPFEDKEFYLRVSYKDIFRVPTFTENYFNLWGNKNLKPETTRQYNFGFTYEKNNRLERFYFQGPIDGYYNQVKNKIVAMPYNMFFWTMINLGEVEILGTDITAKSAWQLTPFHRLLATLSYSYQQAIDKTDPNTSYYKDQIPYTPKHSGSFSLNWENQWLNLAFHTTGTDIRYSSIENIKANEIKGYFECGLALYRSYLWLGKQWTIRGDLINLTDKQYDVVKNYPMPGRSYKLTLNVIL
jgi:outer membrane receptor protein involved in Fe transport